VKGPRNLALSGPYHSMAARVTCLLPCVHIMRRLSLRSFGSLWPPMLCTLATC